VVCNVVVATIARVHCGLVEQLEAQVDLVDLDHAVLVDRLRQITRQEARDAALGVQATRQHATALGLFQLRDYDK
jgi:hypothetical protein